MTEHKPAPRDRLLALASSCWGLGYAPAAPGTVATLPAVGLYLLVAAAETPQWTRGVMGLALLLTCAAAVPLGYWAERYWKTHDPKYFVLDEAAGFFLTALLIREGDVYWTALCAFLATRFFDVVKPFPARRLERLPGGWGILLDDLAASLYAAASLHAAAWLFPQLPGPLRLLAPF